MSSPLPSFVGGLMAIAALGSSTLAGVDPVHSTIRGVVAFVVGVAAGSIWNIFFSAPSPVRLRAQSPPEDATAPHPPENESSKAA